MSDELACRVAELLACTDEPISVSDIAAQLECASEEIDQVVWDRPQQFAWQPGHRWTLQAKKPAIGSPGLAAGQEDARSIPLAPRDTVELRAITLTSGVTLKIEKRPIDSSALFTTESRGSELRLTMNSSHPVFADHPMPFSASDGPNGYKDLTELLFEAWAVFEDGVPTGSDRRRLQDIRMMWGRRLAQLVSDRT